ncbi:MAG: 1-acyl-sn-glycerol-3-phosphate acyltransferase [Marinilabiliales bacterium]|nr:1-acyl-sn-glycerol-3-phosphate acyltransferase [Marinilabiliales bacterium]
MRRLNGYEVLRYYVRYAFWLTHRRVVVRGLSNIPRNSPVVFAANHQNALMDPLALVCTNPLQTFWMTRADIFKIRGLRPLLRFLKMIPIYRIRDGKDALGQNEAIFHEVSKLLERGGSVALFPEAAHSGRRSMLPHKKAIPRMVLEAEAKHDFLLGVEVVPVGIFYDHYWRFGRTLIVQYGEPIHLKDFKEPYQTNGQSALLQLRDRIQERLLPLTLNLDTTSHYAEFEVYRQLMPDLPDYESLHDDKSVLERFCQEQTTIDNLFRIGQLRPQMFDILMEQCAQMIPSDPTTPPDLSLSTTEFSGSQKNLVLSLVLAILSLPLFVLGAIGSVIPYLLTQGYVKQKVKDKAFRSSFAFVLGLVAYPCFYLAGSIWVGSMVHSFWVGLGLFLLLPLLGKWAFRLFRYYTMGYRKFFPNERSRKVQSVTEAIRRLTKEAI